MRSGPVHGNGSAAFTLCQICQQRTAPLLHIPPCPVKIPGVPRIGDIARRLCIVQQTPDFPRGVPTADPAHIPDIFAVHPDQQIVGIIVGAPHLPRRFPGGINPVPEQQAADRRIDAIADFLGARGRGGDFKLISQPCLLHKLLHHKFSHRAAADIAVAYK